MKVTDALRDVYDEALANEVELAILRQALSVITQHIEIDEEGNVSLKRLSPSSIRLIRSAEKYIVK